MNVMRSSWLTPVVTLLAGAVLSGAPVRIPDGTLVPVRLTADLRSNQVEPGDRVNFKVARPVVVRGVIVIPEGAVAWGTVQGVRRNKEIKFDVQGVRLPDLREIKLRSIRKKSDNPRRDVIRVRTDMGSFVGALRGREFMAYIDGQVEVEGEPEQAGLSPRSAAAAPAATTPISTPPTAVLPRTPAAPEAAAPAPATIAPAAAAPQTTPAPTAAPAVAVPTRPAVPARVTPAGTVERVTVECFSIPSGAEILVDGDFYGHTPSILKLDATSHRLDLLLPGYKTYTQVLALTPATSFSTLRVTLEREP